MEKIPNTLQNSAMDGSDYPEVFLKDLNGETKDVATDDYEQSDGDIYTGDKFEKVENPEEHYKTIENLFLIENLSDNLEIVKQQLSEIKDMIRKYDQLAERRKVDLDANFYIDELLLKFTNFISDFKINNKSVDLTKLKDIEDHDIRELHNQLVFEINEYIDHFMIGSGEGRLEYFN